VRSIEANLDVPVSVAEPIVRRALSEVGFGILTEIDVAATLKNKLGVERPALRILGACNPNLAHQALQVDPSLALLLPCNVVIEETGNNRSRVAVIEPRDILTMTGSTDPQIQELGSQASARLHQAVTRVGEIYAAGAHAAGSGRG